MKSGLILERLETFSFTTIEMIHDELAIGNKTC